MNPTRLAVRFSGIVILKMAVVLSASHLFAQAVCLPAPRLLTLFPMGAQQGTTTEVVVRSESCEAVSALIFSHPSISAKPILRPIGNLPNVSKFEVTVQPDCPVGIYEARLVSRLGVSTARAFTVGDAKEITRSTTNTTLESALKLNLDSICNAATTNQSIDHYQFEASKGDRVVIECASAGIDSKLKPVVILGDEYGNDLVVERRGKLLRYEVPKSGTFSIKVHDLTYKGGSDYFYRLVLKKIPSDTDYSRHPSTRGVNAFSWQPSQSSQLPEWEKEQDVSVAASDAQSLNLPCQIAGSFFPAADVDTYEFTARKGETWWVEVASERLGHPTDPSIVIRRLETGATVDGEKSPGESKKENTNRRSVDSTAKQNTTSELVEFKDILSPVKISSNGYSYDGPPYNAGSSDVNGRFVVPADGKYQLQLTDLFGGTRNQASNEYRLVIRKAEPDFSIVAWALHMNLRNGDRNALSKPIALRRGTSMILEVVTVRKDGFDGPIALKMTGLPPGVTASGIQIPKGRTRGYVVVTADPEAPAGYSMAKLVGTATIANQNVVRQGHWASMRWPVKNAWSEIPSPRLVGNMPVSVTASEFAPISLVANEDKIWEVTQGEALKIPLVHTTRSEFSGATLSLKTLGDTFGRNPAFETQVTAEITEATLDLKKLKVVPGDYQLVFYGSAVARYRYDPEAVGRIEEKIGLSKKQTQSLKQQLAQLQENLAVDSTNDQLLKRKDEISQRLKRLETSLVDQQKKFAAAKKASMPKDIVDIVVSKPVTVRVNPSKTDSKP